MLAPFAQQLARAKRKKELLLSCRSAHLDIIFAALRAAETHDSPLIITLDCTKPLLFTPDSLLIASLSAAREAAVPVAVEVIIEPVPSLITRMLEKGAMALAITADQVMAEKDIELLLEASKAAAAFGVDTALALQHGFELDNLPQLIEKTGVHALRAVLHTENEAGKTVLNKAEIETLVQHSKVPIIAEQGHFSEPQIQSLKEAGVTAFTLSTLLEEAFTAGLRTSLRNRSHFVPSYYLQLAVRACEENVITYLNYLANNP